LSSCLANIYNLTFAFINLLIFLEIIYLLH